MEEQYSKDYPITATVAPLMASAPVFVGGPQVVLKPGAPGASNLMRNMAALRQPVRPDTGLSLLANLRAAAQSSERHPDQRRVVWRHGWSICPSRQYPLQASPAESAAHCLRQHLARLLARYRLPCVRPEMSRDDYATRKSPSNSSATSRRSVSTSRWTDCWHICAISGRRVESSMSEVSKRTGRLTRCQRFPGKTPEMASQAVIQRQAGRGAAIMRDAEKALGTNGAQYLQTVDELEKPRLPTQTVLRQDTRCVIAGERRIA